MVHFSYINSYMLMQENITSIGMDAGWINLNFLVNWYKYDIIGSTNMTSLPRDLISDTSGLKKFPMKVTHAVVL